MANPFFGFRLIKDSKEMVRYSNHPDLLAIADQSLEISRLVIHKDVRRLAVGLIKLTARISYEASEITNRPFCTTSTEHKALNKRYRTVPGTKVLEMGIHYPEGPCDGFIFPLNEGNSQMEYFQWKK